jgi:hypothetical protein
MRPSFLTNYLRIGASGAHAVIESLDARVRRRHARAVSHMDRSLPC